MLMSTKYSSTEAQGGYRLLLESCTRNMSWGGVWSKHLPLGGGKPHLLSEQRLELLLNALSPRMGETSRGLRFSLTNCFSVSQDAFRAFHLDLDFVGKFLKPLLIGELAPEEPSLDRGKSVSWNCNIDEVG